MKYWWVLTYTFLTHNVNDNGKFAKRFNYHSNLLHVNDFVEYVLRFLEQVVPFILQIVDVHAAFEYQVLQFIQSLLPVALLS